MRDFTKKYPHLSKSYGAVQDGWRVCSHKARKQESLQQILLLFFLKT